MTLPDPETTNDVYLAAILDELRQLNQEMQRLNDSHVGLRLRKELQSVRNSGEVDLVEPKPGKGKKPR